MKHVKTSTPQELLDNMKQEYTFNPDKAYTRTQALKALRNGADPHMFFDPENPLAKKDPKNPTNTPNHKNYHVRQKAWKLLGCPLPEDQDARDKLLKDLHLTMQDGQVMTVSKAAALQSPKEDSVS